MRNPGHLSLLGVNSTKLEALTRKDESATWGYDHVYHRYYYGYKVHLLYNLGTLASVCFTVVPANKHDNTQTTPLIKRLGARLLQVFAIVADNVYDTKKNINDHLAVGVLFIAARNKRKSKTPTNKYRIQNYLEMSDEAVNRLYKNRQDCEHANFLLKEQLQLTDLKTSGREKVKTMIYITLIARLIQVLHQLVQDKNPRSTIIKYFCNTIYYLLKIAQYICLQYLKP